MQCIITYATGPYSCLTANGLALGRRVKNILSYINKLAKLHLQEILVI